MLKKLGFTLAEVLVTIGVIGVVAALTVPSLMQNAQKRIYVTSLRKAHSEISQAVQLAMDDKHAPTWHDAWVGADEFFSNYLKVSSNVVCNNEYFNITGFGNSFKNLNGSSSEYPLCPRAVLKDGSMLYIMGSELFIDVNGTQGPNVGGRDIFHLYITESGDIVGYQGYNNVGGHTYNSSSGVTADNAFSHIVNDGWEMNY